MWFFKHPEPWQGLERWQGVLWGCEMVCEVQNRFGVRLTVDLENVALNSSRYSSRISVLKVQQCIAVMAAWGAQIKSLATAEE